MRAKRNYGGHRVDPRLDLAPHELERGFKAYEDWHWGAAAHQVVDWDDPDMPRMLIECGRLVRLQVRAPLPATGSLRQRHRDAMIELSRRASATSHIAYDPDHADDRLYLLLDSAVRAAVALRFWHDNAAAEMPLAELAALAGGRHGRKADYPNLMVKPVGVLTAVVYCTHKQGDGDVPSYYIHKLGEVSGICPILAADEAGRLWMAGGNYQTPTPGITD